MSEPLSRERIAELRALAEKATPGPWKWDDDNMEMTASAHEWLDGRGRVLYDHDNDRVVGVTIVESDGGAYGPGNDTGRFIAACDPDTVRALLAAAARVAALEGLLRRAQQNLRFTRRRYRNNVLCWCARPVPQDERHSTHCEYVNELLADIEAALRAENGGGEK